MRDNADKWHIFARHDWNTARRRDGVVEPSSAEKNAKMEKDVSAAGRRR